MMTGIMGRGILRWGREVEVRVVLGGYHYILPCSINEPITYSQNRPRGLQLNFTASLCIQRRLPLPRNTAIRRPDYLAVVRPFPSLRPFKFYFGCGNLRYMVPSPLRQPFSTFGMHEPSTPKHPILRSEHIPEVHGTFTDDKE
jgi:hypothetical protein